MNINSYKILSDAINSMGEALLRQKMMKRDDQQRAFDNQLRTGMAELQKKQTDASIAGAERDFGFRQSRAGAEDARDARNFDYSKSRDQVGDTRYTDTTQYSRGRDTLGDQRYQQQMDRQVGRDQADDNYKAMEMSLRKKELSNRNRGSVRLMGDDGEQYTVPMTDDQLGQMQQRLQPGGQTRDRAPLYNDTNALLDAVRKGKISKDDAKAYAVKQGWN